MVSPDTGSGQDQEQLAGGLKQHDGQRCNTDGVTEGWQVSPRQEDRGGHNKSTHGAAHG